MEELIKKIKKHLEGMNNKKIIYNLFIILLLSIITLIGADLLLGNKNSNNKEPEYVREPSNERVVEEDYSSYLENRLEAILTKLQGVGEVDVMITFEDSIESIPAANTTKTIETTKEIDSEGGTREVNREDTNIQMVNRSGDGPLVVVKEINPTVKGVIVVAEGADDGLVLERLYEAVKTVLGISANKVQVYSSK